MKRLMLVVFVLLACVSPVRAQESPRGTLYIPRLGLQEAFYTAPIGADRLHTIGPAIYWLDQTAWIDDAAGRVVLAAHSPGPFEHIRDLQLGDTLVVYDDVISVYEVVDIRVVSPNDIMWVMPTATKTLTLITCTENDMRLVITAINTF